MSEESVKKFMLNLSGDSKLLEGLDKHSKDAESETERLQSICNLAKEKGYDFDLTELKEVMEETKDGGISDDELEGVAGGAVNWKQGALGAAMGLLNSFAKHGFTKQALKEGALVGGIQGLTGLMGEEEQK